MLFDDHKSLENLTHEQLVKRLELLKNHYNLLDNQRHGLKARLLSVDHEIEQLTLLQEKLLDRLRISKPTPKTPTQKEREDRLIQEISEQSDREFLLEELKTIHSFDTRKEIVLSTDMDEKEFLDLFRNDVRFDEDFYFLSWILSLNKLSSHFLNEVLSRDLHDDRYQFKIELKLMALSHENANEEVLRAGLDAHEMDVRIFAAKRILEEDRFKHLRAEANRALNVESSFKKRSQSQYVLDSLLASKYPDLPCDEVLNALEYYKDTLDSLQDREFASDAYRQLEKAYEKLTELYPTSTPII